MPLTHSLTTYFHPPQSDFDGHAKRSDNNLHVYSSVYGSRCVGIGAQYLPVEGFQEVYVNNTCILGEGNDEVYGIPFQDAFTHKDVTSAAEFQARFISGGNTIYIPGGATKGVGPFKTFQDFAASGYEVGTPSTVNPTLPSADAIIALGKALLLPSRN